MKNGVKNGKNTQFNRNNQPSPQAKSQGWERRKQAQFFMDRIMELLDLTVLEFENIEKDIKKHKDRYTVRDLMAIRYVSNSFNTDKFLLDWLDRHVSKAPQNKDEDDIKDPITKIVVEIADSKYNLEELV